MITEDYCSFETSKLLKEKGFKDSYLPSFTSLIRQEGEEFQCCPTHALAMKWLREVHKIDIFIDTDFPVNRMKYTYKIVRIYKDGDKYTDVMGGSFDTYEGAVEAAIHWLLENLI